MSTVNRRTGVGGALSFAGTTINGRTKWSWDGSANVEELNRQSSALTERVVTYSEWEASVDFETSSISRDLTPSLSIGSLVGMILESYKLNFEVKLDDSVGQEDLWVPRMPTRIDVSLDVDGWVPSTSWGAFATALVGQQSIPSAVLVTTPVMSFYGVIDKSGIEGEDVVKESFAVKLANAVTFTQTEQSWNDHLISSILGVKTALEGGLTPEPGTLILPCGSGAAFLSKLEYEFPVGHITANADFSGVGEFSLS